MNNLIKNKNYLTNFEKKGVLEFIKEIKLKLKDNLLSIKILGSKINGNFNSYSDIDLFILVKNRSSKVCSLIAEIATKIDLKYNLDISPLVLSLKEHQKNIYFQSMFVNDLQKKGITLYESTTH